MGDRMERNIEEARVHSNAEARTMTAADYVGVRW